MKLCLLPAALSITVAACASVPANTEIVKGSSFDNADNAAIACPAGSEKKTYAQTFSDLFAKERVRHGSDGNDGYVSATVINSPAATYPRMEAIGNVSGFVSVAVLVNPKGRVVKTEVVCSTNFRFEVAAVEAARNTRYEPSTMSGVPFADVVIQPFDFQPR